MEEFFRDLAARVALTIELGAVVLIGIGAAGAFVRALMWLVPAGAGRGGKRSSCVLPSGCCLDWSSRLAADVIRSAIAPTWTSIGQLGAIAAIRTGLNYFLEKDIAEFDRRTAEAKP